MFVFKGEGSLTKLSTHSCKDLNGFSHGWLWLPGRILDVCKGAQDAKCSALWTLSKSYLVFLKNEGLSTPVQPMGTCHTPKQKIGYLTPAVAKLFWHGSKLSKSKEPSSLLVPVHLKMAPG